MKFEVVKKSLIFGENPPKMVDFEKSLKIGKNRFSIYFTTTRIYFRAKFARNRANFARFLDHQKSSIFGGFW